MGVMESRRIIMTLGGSMSVGDFTKYETKTLTFPNASDTSTWEAGAIIPCSFEPKLIVFTIDDDTARSAIIRGVVGFSGIGLDCGGVRSRNSGGSLFAYALYSNPTASAGRYKFENGTVYICRATSDAYWSPSNVYTFEIYG